MDNDTLAAALAKLQTGVDAIAREQAAMREDMTGLREDMTGTRQRLDNMAGAMADGFAAIDARFIALETGMNRRFDFLAAQLLGLRKPVDVSDIPGDTYAEKLVYLLTQLRPH